MIDVNVTLGSLPLYGTDAEGVTWFVARGSLDGWWGMPVSTISPQQRTRANGAWAGDAWLGARHLTLTGLIIAPTRPAAVAALDSLKAIAPTATTTLTVEDAGVPLSATVRRVDEVLPEWVNDTSVRYSIQFVALDPRKTGPVLTATTGLPSTSGGFTFPMTFPLTITATTVAGQVALENPGTTAGKVTMRIDGPITGPVITHVNSGRSLTFASSIVIPAGGWIDVDMDARTVLENGTASRSAWVTERGWSGFEPGMNVWAFSAASGSGTLTVNGSPSWI